MQKLHFTLSELCINAAPIPQDVANKLLQYHIWPMNKVRDLLGSPIFASEKSGYRPPAHERTKGRSGTSQHCFLPNSKGAVDWTTDGNLLELIDLMEKHTGYTRLCFYKNNGFIHADYKFPERGRRYFEAASLSSPWDFKRNIK